MFLNIVATSATEGLESPYLCWDEECDIAVLKNNNFWDRQKF